MGKHGELQISILKIGDINEYEYEPTKENEVIPLNEIINDFEKRVNCKINGGCDSNCLDFDTNYGYNFYSKHFDAWINKYDLTISIFHSYGDDADYGDRTELYYLGKYAIDYTIKNIHNVHIDDILSHVLNKTNIEIIKKMQKDIDEKVIQLLKIQRNTDI
jgi:hypothetical protein